MKCDKSCCGANEAKYLLVNGREKERLCEPGLKDRLLDLVTHNDTITFGSGDKGAEGGLQAIEVV